MASIHTTWICHYILTGTVMGQRGYDPEGNIEITKYAAWPTFFRNDDMTNNCDRKDKWNN